HTGGPHTECWPVGKRFVGNWQLPHGAFSFQLIETGPPVTPWPSGLADPIVPLEAAGFPRPFPSVAGTPVSPCHHRRRRSWFAARERLEPETRCHTCPAPTGTHPQFAWCIRSVRFCPRNEPAEQGRVFD